MLDAGRLTERLTLTWPDDADSWGDPVAGESVTTWAAVEAIEAKDRPGGNAVMSASALKATIRWRSDVTTALTASWRGAAYRVVAVDGDSRREALTLYLAAR